LIIFILLIDLLQYLVLSQALCENEYKNIEKNMLHFIYLYILISRMPVTFYFCIKRAIPKLEWLITTFGRLNAALKHHVKSNTGSSVQ